MSVYVKPNRVLSVGYRCLIVGLCSYLVACAPSRPEVNPAELLRLGKHVEAARAYLQWAGREDDAGKAVGYRITAAEAFLRVGMPEQAEQVMAVLGEELPSLSLERRRNLFMAHLHLEQGRSDEAMRWLSRDVGRTAEAPVVARWHRLRARTRLALGEPMLAVDEWIQAAALSPSDDHAAAIWSTINQIPLTRLRGLATRARDTLSGWVELSIIDRTLRDTAKNWTTATRFWRQQYPDHPALKGLFPALRKQNLDRHRLPGGVALLLPTTGEFSQAAATIRSGFLSAWYQNPQERPLLNLYDTDEADVASLYRQAVADGADVVVGPLRREQVVALRQLADFPVPVLALNQSSGDSAAVSGFFEFGFGPEDEARQLVSKAWFDGNQSALILAPDSEWGERVTQALRDNLHSIGGIVLAEARHSLGQDNKDYLNKMQQLTHINVSNQRIARLRNLLGAALQATSRTRNDLQSVFLVASEEEARQVIPQLRYLEIEGLNIYATSHTYSGSVSSEAALDMDEVMFLITPWLLDPEPPGADDWRRFAAEEELDEAYSNLFAFGMDAYHLAISMNRIRAGDNIVYEGMSGRLVSGANGRIRRLMDWAIFYGGKVTQLELHETQHD